MSEMQKLSITLTKQQAEMVRASIESGRFASTSEVIRDALRAWEREEEEHRERIARIKEKIQRTLESDEPMLTVDEVRENLRSHLGSIYGRDDAA